MDLQSGMAPTSYDIIIIGGGFGGTTLAKVMAEHGANILVLESELRFKDRVRGEVLPPWGVAEAKELGIYDLIKQSGGIDVEWLQPHSDGIKGQRRHMPTVCVTGTGALNFYHPDMQSTFIEAAASAGAEVRRGARVQNVEVGDKPRVQIEEGGREQEFTCRIVVGADGRASHARSWGGFQVSSDPDQSLFAGILFENIEAPEDTQNAYHVLDQGLRALLFPLGKGRARAYICYPAASGERFSGARDVHKFVEWSRKSGVPPELYANAEPAGPLATFNAASRWVEHAYQNHIALIGDAASATDPTWGQGLSLTARDVRVLRDQLLLHENWDEAGHAYAEERDKYYTVSRICESWINQLLLETGPEAEARRAKALPLWKEDPTRNPETGLNGPDIVIDDYVRRRFFGEE